MMPQVPVFNRGSVRSTGLGAAARISSTVCIAARLGKVPFTFKHTYVRAPSPPNASILANTGNLLWRLLLLTLWGISSHASFCCAKPFIRKSVANFILQGTRHTSAAVFSALKATLRWLGRSTVPCSDTAAPALQLRVNQKAS